MPLRIFRSRQLSAANLSIAVVGASTFAMWFFLSLYLQEVLGYSPLKAGIVFLPMTLAVVVGSTVASRITLRVGRQAGADRRHGAADRRPRAVDRHRRPQRLPRCDAGTRPARLVRAAVRLHPERRSARPPASNRMRPAWPPRSRTRRGCSAGRSDWPFSRRSRPPTQTTSCVIRRSRFTPRTRRSCSGFQLSFWIAAGIAAFGVLVAAFGMPSPRRATVAEQVASPGAPSLSRCSDNARHGAHLHNA